MPPKKTHKVGNELLRSHKTQNFLIVVWFPPSNHVCYMAVSHLFGYIIGIGSGWALHLSFWRTHNGILGAKPPIFHYTYPRIPPRFPRRLPGRLPKSLNVLGPSCAIEPREIAIWQFIFCLECRGAPVMAAGRLLSQSSTILAYPCCFFRPQLKTGCKIRWFDELSGSPRKSQKEG